MKCDIMHFTDKYLHRVYKEESMHESHWHYRKCPECGSMILSKSPDAYNSPCKKCAKLNRKSSRPRMRYDPDNMIVDYDPLEVDNGGFRSGVPITQIQVECMCQLGTFSEGTILHDKHNSRYQVCSDMEGKQRLMPLNA